MAVNRPDPVRNLGHKATDASLTKNPAGRIVTYDTAPQAERQIKEGQRLTQGVYRRHAPIKSGISSADNLQAWSKYSRSNTYDGGPGPGREPTMRDQGRSSVPSPARSKDSDGHLASTKNWASYEYGGDSGLGRLAAWHPASRPAVFAVRWPVARSACGGTDAARTGTAAAHAAAHYACRC
jgi:hypothetical protein